MTNSRLQGVKNVTLDGVAVTNWESRCLPLTGDTVVKVASLPVSASPGPATIFAGTLTVAGTPADTYNDFDIVSTLWFAPRQLPPTPLPSCHIL